MKQIRFIYSEKGHKWGVIARDPEKPQYMIDTNECLIINDDEAVMTDPGGIEIFPAVFSAISSSFNPKNIKTIFSSHQDPDIISSLTLWLEVNPNLKCHVSRLWTTFIPHFGGNHETIIGIPDEGGILSLGNLKLQMIPAHYLHSPGNFHLYDSRARIYFSGDIGAAILPDVRDIYVKDFDNHIQFARPFHQRWMGSNEAKMDWCERVSKLEIDMMVPQHGSIYQGKDVERFINWLCDLKIGLFTISLDSIEKNIIVETGVSEPVVEPEISPGTMIQEIVEEPKGQLNETESAIPDDSDLKALMNQNQNVGKSFDLRAKSGKKSIFSRLKDFFKSKK